MVETLVTLTFAFFDSRILKYPPVLVPLHKYSFLTKFPPNLVLPIHGQNSYKV